MIRWTSLATCNHAMPDHICENSWKNRIFSAQNKILFTIFNMWSLQYEAMKQLINFGYFTFQPLQETSHLVIYTRSSHNKARAFVIFFY